MYETIFGFDYCATRAVIFELFHISSDIFKYILILMNILYILNLVKLSE